MLCLSLTAFAETELQTPSDDDISVCYLYTDKISGTLSITNKAATCKSTVRGISGTTTKIVITQTLQKKNGSSWTKYGSWTKTFNSWYAIYSNSKESLSSGIYRVKTTADVTAAQSMKLSRLSARLFRVDERGWQLKGGELILE